MALPSVFSELIRETDQQKISVIKKKARDYINRFLAYVSKQSYSKGVGAPQYAIQQYANAAFNPAYGSIIPTDSAGIARWRMDVQTKTAFKDKYGWETIYFIDAMAAGATGSIAEQRLMQLALSSKDAVLAKCIDKPRIDFQIDRIITVRKPLYESIRIGAGKFSAKLYTGGWAFGSGDYQQNYYNLFGNYPESGEYPPYRDIMSYKSALFNMFIQKNVNTINDFKRVYPRTASNIKRNTDASLHNNPVWRTMANSARQVMALEVSDFQREDRAILKSQGAMTEFEVYAFNSRISLINLRRDERLRADYNLRDEMEKGQIKLVTTIFKKSYLAGLTRRSRLKTFILDVKCRFSGYKPSITYYAEILKKDMNLRTQKFEDMIVESVQKVIDEIYPPAVVYFTPEGKTKYPKALNVMENVPWPDSKAMDNGYRIIMGWGSADYARARYDEFVELLDELKRKNVELISNEVDIQKAYFKLRIKDKRPMFPFVGQYIKTVDDRKDFFSEVERPGFMFIDGLGYINFAKVPAPITLGIDIAINYKAKDARKRQLERALEHKRWEERYSKSVLGRLSRAVTQISHAYGNVLYELNPIRIVDEALKSSPITSHMYNELDKLTGGTISGLNNVILLPSRALKGDPISDKDLMEAVGLALKAGVIVVSGGSAAAIIGVAAGQMKKGTIGKNAFGMKLLEAVEIGAYVWTAGDAIAEGAKEKGFELTEKELVVEVVKDYGTQQVRGVVQIEVLKKTGLDKSTLGSNFGTAVFSTVGPGAQNNFDIKEVVGVTVTQTAKQEAGMFVEEKTGGIVKGSYIEKTVGDFLPDSSQTTNPQTASAQIAAEAMSKVKLYKEKTRVMDMLADGKMPSLRDLRLVHPEAIAFKDMLKDYVPELQMPEAMNKGLSWGLPKFEMPNWGLPDISLPGIDIPKFLQVSLPSIDMPSLGLPKLGKFNVPDLPSLGINIPRIELPDFPGVTIPVPDIRLPSIDLDNLLKNIIPRGVPLYTGLNVDPYYFNIMDLDGAVFIRPELRFSPYEHAMLRVGLIPRHLTGRQIAYLKARDLEYKNAILLLKQMELEQRRIISEIYRRA